MNSTNSATVQPIPENKDCDEKPMRLMLFGRNQSSCVELDGWTRDLPIKFVGLKDGLCIKRLGGETGINMNKDFEKEISSAVKLKDLRSMDEIGFTRINLPHPIMVQILAKKALDIRIKDKLVLLFGNLLVGDESGFCELSLFNDAIYTFYQQIKVGDWVLISSPGGGKIGASKHDEDYKSLCFSLSDYLEMELKVSNFNCRHVYKLESRKNSLLPKYCLKDRQILSASDLTPNLNCCAALDGTPPNYYFDIVGVISHVGRLERFRRGFEGEVLLEGREEANTTFFNVNCYIELVDKTSVCSVPLEFYFNHDSWHLQREIVPGSLIIVTHVQRGDDTYHPLISSSRFSQIFVNREIGTYLKLFPTSMCQRVTQFFGKPNASAVFSKKEIVWSAGGTYCRPIYNQEKFWKYVTERKLSSPPSVNSMIGKCFKREKMRFIFKGFIRKHFKICTDGIKRGKLNSNAELLNQNFVKCKDNKTDYPVVIPLPPHHCSWYMSSYELPTKLLNDFSRSPRKYSQTPTALYEAIGAEYKKYCDPLRMPVVGDVNVLKNLPTIDTLPCLVVEIVNEDADPHEQYFCVWKPGKLISLAQMESKLEEALNSNRLYFMLDVHYIDDKQTISGNKQGKVCEFILQDFTIIEETAGTGTKDQ